MGRWQFGDEKKISVPVSGSLKANNGDALVAAAIAGQGIVCQPTFLVAREIAAGSLVPIRLDHNPAPLDGIFAVYPPDRRPAPKVRTFIDFGARKLRPGSALGRDLSRRSAEQMNFGFRNPGPVRIQITTGHKKSWTRRQEAELADELLISLLFSLAWQRGRSWFSLVSFVPLLSSLAPVPFVSLLSSVSPIALRPWVARFFFFFFF